MVDNEVARELDVSDERMTGGRNLKAGSHSSVFSNTNSFARNVLESNVVVKELD